MKTVKALRIIALLALLGSLMVLAGWMLNTWELKSSLPHEIDVTPNTAFGFLFCSAALFLLAKPVERKRTYLMAASCLGIFIIGAVTLYEYFSGHNTGFDEIFRPLTNAQTEGISMRMAIASAACFALTGPAFFMIYLPAKRWRVIGQYLLNLITLLSLLGILGYLYRMPSLYKPTAFTPAPIRNSLSFFIMSVGASMVHPELGLSGLLTGPYIGNVMARRLLPATLLTIFLLGYFRLESMRLHLFGDEVGIILAFCTVFLFSVIILTNTAVQLNKIDIQRLAAAAEVDSLNRDLKAKNEEIRTAMQKLELNNQYLEQLAYISAHDIKSPILTLDGLVDILHKEKAVKEECTETLAMISGTIQQMQRTNNSLNNILKLRKTLLIPAADSDDAYSLQTIIADIKATLRPQIELANARIDLDIDSLSGINFPYVHLKSVFYNLLSNSLKYRDPNRPLIIKLGARQFDKNGFEFYVEDNGLGIDTDRNKDKLFGIFKRFHDHVEGSGIGLHMVKSIIEAYGGTIQVSSETDKGTRFTFTWNNFTFA